jgi:secreted trypsin-like serine protease
MRMIFKPHYHHRDGNRNIRGRGLSFVFQLLIVLTTFCFVGQARAQFVGTTAQRSVQMNKDLRASIVNPGALSLQQLRQNQIPQIKAFDSWLSLSKSVGADILTNSSFRIIGGSVYNGIPAVGAVFYGGDINCTGTIIASHTVLTAAHCIDGYDPKAMNFVTGTEVLAPGATHYAIVAGKIHEQYNPAGMVQGGISNDIGVLYLAQAFPGASVPLPTSDLGPTLQAGKLGFIGYGYTLPYQGGVLGEKRIVQMSVKSVDPTTFTYSDPGLNTCNGDSGGPALKYLPNGYVLAGLTSWGDSPCAQFGVDTRVDAYEAWLNPLLK